MITITVNNTATYVIKRGEVYEFVNATLLVNSKHTVLRVVDIPFSDTNKGFPIPKNESYKVSTKGSIYVKVEDNATSDGEITITNTTTGVS